jgi:GT2 family glycosyltransferase/Flp pilus assembly protein TadD/glycogen synthase/SAM-dependent methyltransferase
MARGHSKGASPLVSICCTTFNHEKYLEECIEGILIQKADFPIEVIIHDDASTDRSPDIIQGYVDRYPDLFTPVYQNDNQYSKGKKPLVHFVFPKARGKYICLCEGDDYWTDPLKIKKQIDFLEKHSKFVMCYHDTMLVDENSRIIKSSYLNSDSKKDFSKDELIKGAWCHTLTRCYRNVLSNYPEELNHAFNGDTFLTSLLGFFGKGKYMADIAPAAYRKHPGSIWSSLDELTKLLRSGSTRVWLHRYYRRLGQKEYAAYFKRLALNYLARAVENMVLSGIDNENKQIEEVLHQYMDIIDNDIEAMLSGILNQARSNEIARRGCTSDQLVLSGNAIQENRSVTRRCNEEIEIANNDKFISLLDKLGWKDKAKRYVEYFEKASYFKIVKSPAVSIIVISWRLHPDTQKNLEILEKQRDNDFELIFVDNGCGAEEFESLKPYIDTYVRLNANTGAYLARNIGAVFARSPILFFLEDDGIPENDLVKTHIKIHFTYDVIAVRGVYRPKTKENPFNQMAKHYYLGDKPFPVYADLEGNTSYRAMAFFYVGGWDDDIHFGGGGVELAIRLAEYDNDFRKQIYTPSAVIYHDYATDQNHLNTKKERQEASKLRLRRKHPSWDEVIRKLDQYSGREDLLIRREPERSAAPPLSKKKSRPIVALTTIECEKTREELAYWMKQKKSEGELGNGHYKYFYTQHFGLTENFYKGKRILDIGCGPRGSLEWAHMALSRVGLDPLAHYYNILGIEKHAMLYAAGVSESLPFPDENFDVVTSFNSLDHVENLDLSIFEIKRVLKPNGTFLLLADVNHKPTACEPILLSWEILDRFKDSLSLIEERHYERGESGIYGSVREGVPFDHSTGNINRHGVISARLTKAKKAPTDENCTKTMCSVKLPFVSIVIPVFNAQETLELCLDSISKLTYPADKLEVIVVDNGSADGSAAIARKFGVTVLHEVSMKSSYAARNVGIRAARGDLIAFTDADCIVTRNWLKYLAAHWEAANIGCFAGEIQAYQPLDIIEIFSDRAGILRQNGTLSCPYLPYTQTANSAYRKAVFDRIGLFNPEMTSGGDADLAWRMQKQLGLKIKFIPEAIVYHKHRTSIQTLFDQFRKYEHGKILWRNSHPDFTPPTAEQRRKELAASIAKVKNALEPDTHKFLEAKIDLVDLVTPFLKHIMALGTLGAHLEMKLDRMPDTPPLISVVIPTYNRASLLKQSLESFARQTIPAEQFEVVVIDDGSDDLTKDVCGEIASTLRLVFKRIENSGIAAAKNIGISECSAPVILFFDDDDIAHPQLLEEHLKFHRKYPKENIAVLGYTSWEPSLVKTELMRHVTEIGRQMLSYPNISHGQLLDYRYFWGGRSSCKKSFLTAHGLFSEEFRFGCEDIELGYRLDRFGLKVVHNRNAVSYINRQMTFDEFCRRCEKQGRSQYQFSKLHPDPDILDYCMIPGAETKWRQIEMSFDRMIKETKALEAQVASSQGDDAAIIKNLHDHYALVFNAFKIKGIVEAMFEDSADKAPGGHPISWPPAGRIADGQASSAVLPGQEAHPRGVVDKGNPESGYSILIVAKELPFYDRSSGNFRMFQIIRGLVSQGHRVTFLARPSFRKIDESVYVEELEKLGVTVLKISDEKKFIETEQQSSLKTLLNRAAFDIAYLMFYSVADLYLERIRTFSPATRIVVDSVDIHFLREFRQNRLAGHANSAAYERNKQIEIGVYRKADLVVVLTEDDRRTLLAESPQVKTAIIPNIHPTMPEPPAGWESRRDIVFVGGFTHEPNVDAVHYFCGQIWPHVSRQLPQSRLVIAGNAPPLGITRLASERMIVTGYVKDINALLGQCRVSIAPLRYGAGMKGKVGEALTNGLPVVATSIAAEGMGLRHGEHLLVADSAEAFARCVVELYQDETLWGKLARNGQAYIDRHFSPKAATDKLRKMVNSLYPSPPVAALSANEKARGGTSDEPTVVIPIFNAFDETMDCIYSVLQHTPKSTRVILIDDCSTDPRIWPMLVEFHRNYPQIEALRNETNQGYTKTINRGCLLARGDVILLNSDTRVTREWVEKLQAAAYCKEKVATVTPLSNAAGAFSIPYNHRDNTLPEGMSTDQFAEFVDKRSLKMRPEVPTGNGFCLYIRREAFDKVGYFDDIYFPDGYGEENDFCMRCIHRGMVHLIEDSTFIYHKRTASFKGRKEGIVNQSQKTLQIKHPSYHSRVRQWLDADPLDCFRAKLVSELNDRNKIVACKDAKTQRAANTVGRVLFVNHSLYPFELSGTPISTLNHALGIQKYGVEVAVLIPSAEISSGFKKIADDKYTLYIVPRLGKYETYFGEIENAQLEKYLNSIGDIIDDFNPEIVHINDYVFMPIEIISLFSKRGAYVVRNVCNPEELCHQDSPVYFDGKSEVVCSGPDSPGKCAECFLLNVMKKEKSRICENELGKYTNKVQGRFDSVRAVYQNDVDGVIFTENSFKDYFTRFVSIAGEKILINARGIKFGVSRELVPKKPHKGIIHVGYIGSLIPRKGINLILTAFQQICNTENFKLDIYGSDAATVYLKRIGELEKEHPGKIKFHGKFINADLARIAQTIDFAVVPSYFETYNRVVRELMYFGIPLIVTDFFGASIIENDVNGIKIKIGDRNALLESIKMLLYDEELRERLSRGALSTEIPNLKDEIEGIYVFYGEVIKRTGVKAGSHERTVVGRASEEMYAKALHHANEGGHEVAIEMLTHVVLEDPEHALACNDLAVLYTRGGNYEKALSFARAACQKEPANFNFKKNLADLLYVAFTNVEEALPIYVEIMKAFPNDIDVLTVLGRICLQMADYETATSFYKRIIELQPDNPEAQKALSVLNDTETTQLPEDSVENFSEASIAPINSLEKIDSHHVNRKMDSWQCSESISIIIPIYNQLEHTKRCLDSVMKNTSDDVCEIIIVDNASSDGTPDYLESLGDSIKVVTNALNYGFARGCNQGALNAKGSLLLFLNNDTVVTAGWLEPLLKTIRRPKVGIVGCKLLYPDGRIQHAGISLINGVPDHPHRYEEADLPAASSISEMDMVTGACLLISRELFISLKGFDEIFLNGVEDIDLCLRVRNAGYRVLYQPETVIYHHEGQSSGRFTHVKRNIALFFERWNGFFSHDGKFRVPVQPARIPSRKSVIEERRLRIAWEGSQFVNHSLALVNRELCLRLIEKGCEVSIIPYEKEQFSSENEPRFKPIDENRHRPLSGSADVHVRHQWPPDFNPPREGHWVIVQPWEFGSLPKEWVQGISTIIDEVWVPSRYVRDCYIRSGVSPERVFVVPNGVNTWLYNPGSAPYRLGTTKAFKFLFVGGTIQRKGIDILLDVYTKTFTSKDDVCLVIKDMGGRTFYKGQTAERLIEEYRSAPDAPEIEYIQKLLAEKEMAGLYTACNCLAHPYRGEGFGLPIAEAMASELPVIVTGHGAALDFCTPDNSYLLPAKEVQLSDKKIGGLETVDYPWLAEPDRESFAAMMKRVIAFPAEAKEKARAARAAIESDFTWEKAADAVIRRVSEIVLKPVTRLHYSAELQQTPSNPKVSIIIRVSSSLKNLQKCIQNIKKYTREPHEIIFVVSGANTRALKWLKRNAKEYGNCRYIENKEEYGWAKQINQGIKESSGDYILILDYRAAVGENWLPDLLECMEHGSKPGIVGSMPQGICGRSSLYDKYSEAFLQEVGNDSLFRERNRYRRIPVETINAPCLLFKRGMVDEIGLMDERFDDHHLGVEDFCLRASLGGYQNTIAGDVWIPLYVQAKSAEDSGERERWKTNRRIFNEKWHSSESQRKLGQRLFIFVATAKADELHRKGRIEEATASMLEAIKKDPGDRNLYIKLSEMLIDTKSFDDARGILDSLPDAVNDAMRLALLACCEEGVGSDDKAQEHAACALAIDPSMAVALNISGVVAYKRGERDAAESSFKKAIESDPGFGESYTNLGTVRWEQGEQEEALNLFERGFILSPNIADVVTAYHSAICDTGSFARGQTVFQEARAVHRTDKRIAFLLITMLIQQEKHDLAMREIEHAMIQFGIDDGILNAALQIRAKTGPLEIRPSSTQSSLSICMIVKNEELSIAKCLMSVKPVADEIIVVDTGSADKTKAIASALGAKVFDFPWTSDFSEARNYSLSKASGGWILVLDADELVSPLDHDKLKKLINSKAEKSVAYTMVTRNYTDQAGSRDWSANEGRYIHEEVGRGWIPSPKVRLFANDKRIKFVNPVHELVEPTLEKLGIKIKTCDIPVHHYGRLNQDKLIAKGKEYYRLGIAKIEKSKGEGEYNALRELAIQAAEIGEYAEAVNVWEKVIELKSNDAAAFMNMGFAFLMMKQYEKAAEHSKKAMDLDPDFREAALNYAAAELIAGDVKKAISTLESILKNNSDYPPAIGRLAAACMIDGRKVEGLRYLDKLITKGFDCSSMMEEQARALLSEGRIEQAVLLLQAALEKGLSNISTHVLLGECQQKMECTA